jgi:flagellar operon protein (TIGR03826 family)
MNLINCRECGKVFASTGQKVCPDCRKSEEEQFELVKDYLWDHPNSKITKVSEATGVEEKIIIKFIKENRLQSSGLKIDHNLECKSCGQKINSGIYCENCRAKMLSDFRSDPEGKEEGNKKTSKKSNGMFIGDRFKRNK